MAGVEHEQRIDLGFDEPLAELKRHPRERHERGGERFDIGREAGRDLDVAAHARETPADPARAQADRHAADIALVRDAVRQTLEHDAIVEVARSLLRIRGGADDAFPRGRDAEAREQRPGLRFVERPGRQVGQVDRNCFNYIDRTNIGFAALTMNRDNGLTGSQFGMAAGLFRRAGAIHVDAGTHQARRGGKSEAMSVPRAPLRIMTPTTSSTPPSPHKPASP